MSRAVLIVDDSEINRRILRRILSEDYVIFEAENGQEAFNLLMREHQQISAVLLDIVMPVMDGYAVLEKMSANPALSQIPVIVTTGDSDSGTESKALSLGATDVVTKPFDAAIVMRRLHNLIKLRENSAMMNLYRRDKLTGLWNRESFFEKADWEIRRKGDGYFYLSCLDVDNFKVINDRYGPEKGDQVLKSIAKLIADNCEAYGGICGRISADNFITLCPRTVMEQSDGERRARENELIARLGIPLTISIGRYVVDDKSLSVSNMYNRAKLAQNTVKGRFDVHVAVYDESMHRSMLRRQEITNEMDTALANNQFEVWYQPQYNHGTGALIGAEALARWRHPVWGLVVPTEFVPIFERNGFIYEMDKFVWEQVCIKLQEWTAQGRKPLPVSVNISRYDLFREDLVAVIVALTEKYQISEELLRFEITESAFAESTEHVVRVVQQIIGRGFTVEIDDFGSGYSSLNTLKEVPAQILKLDMRFLEGTDNLDRGGNIVESVVRMAKWLGMAVIAEGVETIAQADYLESIGCNYIQGYLYGRPMPASDYEQLAPSVKKEERLITLETVDNLDNNAFWNPESIDTLIYNSYVGAACIFEYHNKRVELIRSSEKFVQRLGGDITVEDSLRLEWSDHLDDENKSLLADAIHRSAEERDDVNVELVFTALPGCPEKTYIRAALRVIATAGDRSLVYCVVENTTRRHEAEQRAEAAAEPLRFLNEVSGDLLAQPDIELGIDGVLRKILGYFGADRAYILEQHYDTQTADNTYEICAAGVSSEKPNLQNVPFSAFDYWLKAFDRGEIISIEDVSSLPAEREAEREMLKNQNIHSLIAVSFVRDGQLIGFVGVDNPSCHITHSQYLRSLGDYLAVMLTRRDLMNSVAAQRDATRMVMDDMPGGLVRMRILPGGGGIPVYINDGFCKLVGMSRREVYSEYADDPVWGVHPDDKESVRSLMREINADGGIINMKYRLAHGDGGYVWVAVNGRATESGGERFINFYYSDPSNREKTDLTMRKTVAKILSAIMDSSNDYAFAKDKDFRYLCCSPAFLRLAGLDDSAQAIGKTDYDLFPKDMAHQFRVNDETLFAKGEPIVDYTESIRTLDGEKHFCRASKHILRDSAGEIIGLYGVSRDITVERAASERLHFLNDSLPGGIATFAVTQNQIRVSYYNDGLCKLLGTSRDEYQRIVSSDEILKRVFPEDLSAMLKQVKEIYENGTPVDCTYRYYKIDGTGYVWVNMRGELFERTGETAYINAVLYDVTARYEAEQLARQTAEQLNVIMENINGGVSAVVRENGVQTFVFSNDQYFEMLGYTREQFKAELNDNSLALVYPEDREHYLKCTETNNADNAANTVEFRAVRRDGKVIWLSSKGSVCNIEGINAPVRVSVVFDITHQKEADEALRIREAEYRLAIEGSERYIYRYNHADNSVDLPDNASSVFGNKTHLTNAPESLIEISLVSPESVETYRDFYRAIKRGDKTGVMTIRRRTPNGELRWYSGHFSNVFDTAGKPISAIIVFYDATEEREKESIYTKWQQSLEERNPEDYTLFRWNVSKNYGIDSWEGTLLDANCDSDVPMTRRVKSYASNYVHPEDRRAYLDFIDSDAILAAYHRGMRTKTLEYREKLNSGGYRWLRLTAELVEYPNSTEIEAYMMYENIDGVKKQELLVRRHAERDALTGVLNRSTFAADFNALMANNVKAAFFMLDVDGFKLLNDTLGHAVGDQALVDMADTLRTALRPSDLLGRLGGDEFVVCLRDVSDETKISKKAQQLCTLMRRTYGENSSISTSIGIAVCPRDGQDFDTIYRRADAALYTVKRSGKDGFAFFDPNMPT